MPEPFVPRTPVHVACPGCGAEFRLAVATDALFAIRGRIDHLGQELPPELPVLVITCSCESEIVIRAADLHLSDGA